MGWRVVRLCRVGCGVVTGLRTTGSCGGEGDG